MKREWRDETIMLEDNWCWRRKSGWRKRVMRVSCCSPETNEWSEIIEKVWMDHRTWEVVDLEKSRVRCYNYNILGTYAPKCSKPRRVRDQNQEANMAKLQLIFGMKSSVTRCIFLTDYSLGPCLNRRHTKLEPEKNRMLDTFISLDVRHTWRCLV